MAVRLNQGAADSAHSQPVGGHSKAASCFCLKANRILSYAFLPAPDSCLSLPSLCHLNLTWWGAKVQLKKPRLTLIVLWLINQAVSCVTKLLHWLKMASFLLNWDMSHNDIVLQFPKSLLKLFFRNSTKTC